MKNSRPHPIPTLTVYFTVLFLLLALFASLSSCSKDQTIESDPGAKIEFNLYGSQRVYVDLNSSAQTTGGGRTYTFVGTKSPQAENLFSISFTTDSLRPGTYNLNTGVVMFREGTKVVTNASGSFTLTVTSHSNGIVNGSFAGTLYDHQTGSACSMVNGSIEQVPIIYR
jgi:hypothetical protein